MCWGNNPSINRRYTCGPWWEWTRRSVPVDQAQNTSRAFCCCGNSCGWCSQHPYEACNWSICSYLPYSLGWDDQKALKIVRHGPVVRPARLIQVAESYGELRICRRNQLELIWLWRMECKPKVFFPLLEACRVFFGLIVEDGTTDVEAEVAFRLKAF